MAQPQEKNPAAVALGRLEAAGLVRKGQTNREIDRSLDAAAVTSSIMGATEAMIRDRMQARASGSRGFAEREVQRTLGAMLAGFAGTQRARRKRTKSA